MQHRDRLRPARREIGGDRPRAPLPVVPPPASDRTVTLGRIAILVTVLSWAAYMTTTVITQIVNHGIGSMRFATETVSYVLVVSALAFSAVMYLVARQGALYRSRAHTRVPRADLDAWFDPTSPPLTVLVPSFREDVRVVRKTLLSAALQEYPDLKVVLLIDDDPSTTEPEHRDALEDARALPQVVAAMLAEPAARAEEALRAYEARGRDGVATDDLRSLAAAYAWSAAWLRRHAEREEIADHVDVFFVDQVLLGLAEDLELTGAAVGRAADQGADLDEGRVHQLHRRLAWTFRAELSAFERKRYATLSHAPNKAMNLNAYIGLMGGAYDEVETPRGTLLVEAPDGAFVVPDATYLLTLDADSVLLREYCLRLVHLLEQPQNARVAVTQTPYSAFPGAPTRIERLAGATTDLQHIVHQGMTHHGATFWVGANAVIRKAALESIVEVVDEAGVQVRRYVQDRTVIEDTESSIDLRMQGWTLRNYPERLSYSATPPDFGSLVIQRRRWADGGLLILPKLVRHARERRRRLEPLPATELMLRVNYMGSIAWGTFGLVFLLVYPYDGRLLSPIVVLTSLPYFLAMSSDLKRSGYKRLDVFRVYAFNLVLLPVNLAGVLKSIQQAVTGRKIAFARTPKVKDRTTAPLLFVIAPLLVVAFAGLTFWRAIADGHSGTALFAAFNGVLATYGIVAYIGVRNALVDVVANVVDWLYVEDVPRVKRRDRRHEAEVEPQWDWESVIYHGAGDPRSLVAAERRPEA